MSAILSRKWFDASLDEGEREREREKEKKEEEKMGGSKSTAKAVQTEVGIFRNHHNRKQERKEPRRFPSTSSQLPFRLEKKNPPNPGRSWHHCCPSCPYSAVNHTHHSLSLLQRLAEFNFENARLALCRRLTLRDCSSPGGRWREGRRSSFSASVVV